jgi:hypothetical protein
MANERGNSVPASVPHAAVERVNRARRIRWTDDILSKLEASPGIPYRQLKVWSMTHWHRDFLHLPEQSLQRSTAEADQLLSSLWLSKGVLPIPAPSGFGVRAVLLIASLAALAALLIGAVLGTIDARNDVQACDFDRITTCVPWLQEDFR